MDTQTKNIVVISTWAFIIVWLIGMLVIRGDLFFALVLFLIGIGFSAAILSMGAGQETKLLAEIQDARARLDALVKEMDQLKGAVGKR